MSDPINLASYRRQRAPVVATLADADAATVRQLDRDAQAAVAYRAALAISAGSHVACGNDALAKLLQAQVAQLTTFITALANERLRLTRSIT